jgi:hypothetical protein
MWHLLAPGTCRMLLEAAEGSPEHRNAGVSSATVRCMLERLASSSCCHCCKHCMQASFVAQALLYVVDTAATAATALVLQQPLYHSPLQSWLRCIAAASCFEPLHCLPQKGHLSCIWYNGKCGCVVLQHYIAPRCQASSQRCIVACARLCGIA